MSISTNDITIDINQFKFKEKQIASIANGNHNSYQSYTFNHNNELTKKEANKNNDIKIQVYYCGLIMVIYIKNNLKLEELLQIIRNICKFDNQQLFTIKWVDEEGDPCTLSSQMELDEALRLYYLNKENELIVHIFANIPERPGTQCAGEDRSIYRRGARRWRKIYLVNDHKYQAKRFAPSALCKVCMDRIWGLGRQGYKCLECKIMVHKRCHKLISLKCGEVLAQQQHHNNQLTTLNCINVINSNGNNNQFSSINCLSSQNNNLIDDLKHAQKHKQALRNQQSSCQVKADNFQTQAKQLPTDIRKSNNLINFIINNQIQMAEIVILYHFLFSNFEHINYVFKYGEEKVNKTPISGKYISILKIKKLIF
jgi:hypothetical protein